VGRIHELATIESAFERCLGRAPQTILLAGDAGIGKTRTAEEFAAQAGSRGAMVLVGRCREGEGAPAFWPWVQVVRGLIDQLEPGRINRDVRALAPVLVQMIPELERHFPGLAPPSPLEAEAARFRLFDAVTRLLQKAGSERPLLIMLDDLHQADPASLIVMSMLNGILLG
jgi:predicted ATPase